MMAPNDKPRASCRCAIQPRTRTGRTARVAPADILAQNIPSAVLKDAMKTGRVMAFADVRFRLQND